MGKECGARLSRRLWGGSNTSPLRTTAWEATSESAAAPVSHNAAGPVELNDVCRTKLKLPYQTDSDAVLLPNLIHQLGSAHEWSGV